MSININSSNNFTYDSSNNYSLHQIKDALIYAQKSRRSGKILLDCSSLH